MSESQQEIPDLIGELERLLAQIPPARVTTYGRLADALVRKLLTTHRLPEPLYWADRLSKFPMFNDQ